MECEHPHIDNRLRQGDIFAAHPQTDNWGNRWRRFGVILTADCDLEQGKGGSNLVYVPVVGLQTYLADVWLPNHATSLYEETVRRADKALSEFSGTRMTSRHLLKRPAEEISKELGMLPAEVDATSAEVPASEDGKSRDKAKRKEFEKIRRLREALLALDGLRSPKDPCITVDLGAMLNTLFPQYEYISNTKNPGPSLRRELVYSSLSDLIQDGRVDTWPISDLIGMDPEMRSDESFGFVADLRRFSVLETEKVQTTRTAWLQSPEHYLRICRLGGLYKSALLQKFANLFVRVGLDDRRKDLNLEIFTRLSKRLVPDA